QYTAELAIVTQDAAGGAGRRAAGAAAAFNQQMAMMMRGDERTTSGIKLLDADGHAWYHFGGDMGRPDQDGQIVYEIRFMRHGPGGQAGPPVKLVWDMPGTPREIKVPFE